ncbi:hypothetical protein EI94DRAFT_1702225 [Lactarius quietus]|nr:hypothetical protein EI94DRAFT_1702225 [Lactarius quietus]
MSRTPTPTLWGFSERTTAVTTVAMNPLPYPLLHPAPADGVPLLPRNLEQSETRTVDDMGVLKKGKSSWVLRALVPRRLCTPRSSMRDKKPAAITPGVVPSSSVDPHAGPHPSRRLFTVHFSGHIRAGARIRPVYIPNWWDMWTVFAYRVGTAGDNLRDDLI